MNHTDRLVSIIFCADIIGYTALMQRNESEALAKLESYEETIKRETLRHNGEVIKTYGDGCLILFKSAVEAVKCAIAIQLSLQTEPVVPLRIGIHMGEIVRKNHDVFGNGVNVASRIESMGVAHSVLISSDVYNQIKNQSTFQVAELGTFEFKNVQEGIILYAVMNSGLTVPTLKAMQGKGKIKNRLLPRNLLMVTGLLISALLIVGTIAIFRSLNKSGSHEQANLTENLEALDFYLKGEFYFRQETPAAIDSAIMFYKNAIDTDSEFALAYSKLAAVYMRKYLTFDPDVKWQEGAYTAAGTALLMNPDLADPHLVRGQFFWSQSHNFAHEEALQEFGKAIVKDPRSSEAHAQVALVQLHIGLFEEAMRNARKSIDLDPGNFRARRFIGEAYLFQGSYESALSEFEKIPANFAPLPTQSLKALIYDYLGRPEEALEILNSSLATNPNNPNINSVYAIIMAKQGMIAKADQSTQVALENLRDFIHAHHIYYHLAITAAVLNRKTEAVQWLTRAANTGFPNYPLFNSDPNFQSLRGFNEYEELLAELKMKWHYFETI